MSTKKEIYYKFIFPNYDSLSGSDSDPTPTSDGIDQVGEVRTLCKACPSRVITYDQLTATNPISMYENGNNGWSADKKTTIKNYIDKYLTIPKYFNLRNYWDSYPCQEGGMSLMVSDKPEVGGDYSQYTKFNYGDKTVYCAVMISSGDFFYSFCLPDEVIEKSGLRDEVVRPAQYNGAGTPWLRFHSNWCFNITERTALKDKNLPASSQANVQVGQEKRVFVQHYFNNSFAYGVQNKDNNFYYFDFTSELTGNTYSPFDANIRCVDNNGRYIDEMGSTYTGSNKNFPLKEFVRYYYINGNEADHLTRNEYHSKEGSATRQPWKGIETADNYHEDLKRDFIDLEVTRRILYYSQDSSMKLNYNGDTRNIHPTRDIPSIESGIYYNTKLSYEPPAEYLDEDYTYKYNNYSRDETAVTTARGTPPLQIPYNLLRYCLNDRPPFTDCETVLVMWIANGDPDTISDSDSDKVKKLHDLGWEQYAIPISCRCRFKDPNDRDNGSKHIHHRFLVNYPRRWSLSPSEDNIDLSKSHLTYRYHTRRSEAYDKNDFHEVLYLQDLIQYSSDYIIAYQNSDYVNNVNYGFDIQGYILKNYSNAFKKLYCLKTYMHPKITSGVDSAAKAHSNNHNGQYYYIRVNQFDSNNQKVYDINTTNYSSSNRRICICKPGITDVFKPSDKIYRMNVQNGKWDPNGAIAPSTKVNILGEVKDFGFDDVTYHEKYGYNDWQINDESFIVLFDATYKVDGNSIFTKLYNCTFTLTNHATLYDALDNWDDIYISSLGVTKNNPIHIDSIFHGGAGTTIYPLGILDNHIKLDGTIYGSSFGKIVVGFDNMLDFNQDDMYHFKYINGEYKPVKTVFNYTSSTPNYVTTQRAEDYTCTAYIMKYSLS
jgi:hypothetical protein